MQSNLNDESILSSQLHQKLGTYKCHQEQEEYIELENGAAIDRKFFNRINAYARHRIPQSSPDRVYDLGTLLGEDIISLFDDAEYVFADMCMEHLAIRNLLPLITFRRRSRGSRIYILN
jgi:hypothetical protein